MAVRCSGIDLAYSAMLIVKGDSTPESLGGRPVAASAWAIRWVDKMTVVPDVLARVLTAETRVSTPLGARGFVVARKPYRRTA